MSPYAVVQFESIVLQDQRIRGTGDDYLLSVVHLTMPHPDGRWCPGCLATVRDRFRGAQGGALEISMRLEDECAGYARALEPSIEEYYREHVGTEGTAIRVGPRGASPLLVGVPRIARASGPLAIRDPRERR